MFYETLDGNERGETELPETTEATSFWSGIWWEVVSHNDKASWLEDIEHKLSITGTQEHIIITVEDIRNGVTKMANWKVRGPDLVQGYWFKKLTSIHNRFKKCPQGCVCQGNVPG